MSKYYTGDDIFDNDFLSMYSAIMNEYGINGQTGRRVSEDGIIDAEWTEHVETEEGKTANENIIDAEWTEHVEADEANNEVK